MQLGIIFSSEIPIETGVFSFEVPIGYALPVETSELEFGVASRFQWSSNGLAETTVVHIESISIEGGYNLIWDRVWYALPHPTKN